MKLKMEMMDGQVLEGWEEGNIKFGPTYKYYPNSEVYYGGLHGLKAEKRRAPAWYNIIFLTFFFLHHILYKNESKTQNLFQNSGATELYGTERD